MGLIRPLIPIFFLIIFPKLQCICQWPPPPPTGSGRCPCAAESTWFIAGSNCMSLRRRLSEKPKTSSGNDATTTGAQCDGMGWGGDHERAVELDPEGSQKRHNVFLFFFAVVGGPEHFSHAWGFISPPPSQQLGLAAPASLPPCRSSPPRLKWGLLPLQWALEEGGPILLPVLVTSLICSDEYVSRWTSRFNHSTHVAVVVVILVVVVVVSL